MKPSFEIDPRDVSCSLSKARSGRRAAGVPWIPILVLLSLLAVACGGGGGGGGSNPGPTGPSNLAAINILLFPGTAGGGVNDVRLLFDGREVGKTESCGVGNCAVSANLSDVSRGSHTIVVRIVLQTRPSISYRVSGEVDFAELSTGAVKAIPLELRNVTLREGDTVTYQISI